MKSYPSWITLLYYSSRKLCGFNRLIILEAEMAKNRIEELRAQEFQRRRDDLILNQTRERQEVEEAHLMEYQEFNKNWDNTLA